MLPGYFGQILKRPHDYFLGAMSGPPTKLLRIFFGRSSVFMVTKVKGAFQVITIQSLLVFTVSIAFTN